MRLFYTETWVFAYLSHIYTSCFLIRLKYISIGLLSEHYETEIIFTESSTSLAFRINDALKELTKLKLPS